MALSILFQSKYNRDYVDPGVDFNEPSLTQQHFKDEADINKIIERYNRTGVLVDPLAERSGEPIFGDFSDIKDFREAQNAICAATEAFEALPAKLRQRFNNSPGDLLDFISNPDNIEEGRKLGIFAPAIKESEVVSNEISNGSPVQPNTES